MNRTPRGAPHAVESERLWLRAPARAHGPIVAAGVTESFAELTRWMEWATEIPTARQQSEIQAASRERFLADEEHSWLMFRKEDEEFVGICGMPRPRWSERTLEIGYWLRTTWVGHGYMVEAVRRLTRVGFEDLGAGRIEIQTSDRNVRSYRVAERAGFRLCELRRGDGVHPDGSVRDTRLYALDRPALSPTPQPEEAADR